MDKVRCFLVFVCLFIVHVLSVQQVDQAKGLKRDAILGINYANFVVDMFHYLNVGKVGSALVTKLSECTFKCLKEVSCFSFNLAASPDGDDKLWCELLATDKYNASDKFQGNESSHHYSVYVRCFSISLAKLCRLYFVYILFHELVCRVLIFLETSFVSSADWR